MSPEIIAIHRGTYFKEIYSLCRRNNFADFDALRFVLSPSWSREHTPADEIIGYGMLDKGNLVGFLGCITVTREIHGEQYLTTNATTGIVEKSHRRFTFDFLAESQACLTNNIQLNFSPIPVIYSLCTSLFDFTPLYTHEYLFNRLFLWGSSGSVALKFDVSGVMNYIENSSVLSPFSDLVIDNVRYFAQCAVCCCDDGELLVIFIRRKIEFVNVIQIVFVSDRALFSRHLKQVIKKTAKVAGVFFCFCPPLFIEDSVAEALGCPTIGSDWISRLRCMPSPMMKVPYRPLVRFPKGCDLQASDLDLLYSESVLFRHQARLRHVSTLLGDGYDK